MIAQDEWLNFWFKPQLFLDQSWYSAIDERLLHARSSSLAWHISYSYVCDCLKLPEEYVEVKPGLAANIIHDLLQNDRTIIGLATMMVSSLAVDTQLPTELKRKVLQRNRALSLKKRFAEACDNLQDREYGIYFLYLAIMLETPQLWRRVRLMFKRETVENIEQAGKRVPRTEANAKAVRRAWNEIFQLKNVLRPGSAVGQFIDYEALAFKPETAVASNDDVALDEHDDEQAQHESDAEAFAQAAAG